MRPFLVPNDRKASKKLTTRAGGNSGLKVKMQMISAAGIEACSALRTAVSVRHILSNGQSVPANSTQYGEFIPLRNWPYLKSMVLQGIVAVLACVEKATAFHLDCDNVDLRVIVRTSRLRVYVDSVDFGD